jgi:tetratricopeptide (TPR) repeat protein
MLAKKRFVGVLALSCLVAGSFSLGAAQAESKKVTIHRALADIFEKTGKTRDAMEEYESLIALSPNDANAQVNFGNLLYRQREYQSAIPHFRKAAQLDPSTENWGRLGDALCLVRDYKGALEPLRKGGPKWAAKYQQTWQYLQQLDQINKYKQEHEQ